MDRLQWPAFAQSIHIFIGKRLQQRLESLTTSKVIISYLGSCGHHSKLAQNTCERIAVTYKLEHHNYQVCSSRLETAVGEDDDKQQVYSIDPFPCLHPGIACGGDSSCGSWCSWRMLLVAQWLCFVFREFITQGMPCR